MLSITGQDRRARAELQVRARRCLPPAAALALAHLCATPGADARAAPSASPSPLEEIVVTVRRREERSQDVALTVSAYDADHLGHHQIRSSDQLGDITPNLTVSSSGAFVGARSATQVFIRGIGQTDFLPVTDPGVALYIDGIYVARSVGSLVDLLDIERVEVLRGPQGTLFGRNATGGAITIHSRRPDGHFHASLKGEVGNDRMRNTTARLNVPLADRLAANLVVSTRRRDGYVTRPHDGLATGDDDSLAARGALQWRPTGTFTSFTAVDVTRLRENGSPAVSGGVNDKAAFGAFGNALIESCAAASINPEFPASGPPTFPPPGAGTASAPGCFGPHSFAGAFTSLGTFPTYADLDLGGASQELEWVVSGRLAIKAIAGWRRVEMNASRDADNTPANILATRDVYDHDQFSAEIHAVGTALENRLEWTAGVYYFREDGMSGSTVTLPVGGLHSGGFYANDSRAGFLHLSLRATGRVVLTLGGRYTEDIKRLEPDMYALGDASQVPGSPFSATWPRLAGIYLSPSGPMQPGERILPAEEFRESFNAVTLTASLAYRWNDRVMAYATYAEGFKSGGLDMRFAAPPVDPSTGLATHAPSSFDPERAGNLEVGLKSHWLDNRLRLNLALFRADYDDLQIVIRETFNPITFNGGSARVMGGEAELAWVPSPGWLLTASAGVIDAGYRKLSNAVRDNATPILPGYRLAKTPEFSYAVSLGRTFELGAGTLSPRLNRSYRDSHYHDSVNTPQLLQPGFGLLNAAVSFETSNGRWHAEAAFRNILDERYLANGNSSFATSAAYVELVYGRPCEWSLSLTRTF